MKWRTLNSHILDFMALLSDDALDYFERQLHAYEIVHSPFSIEINSFVSIQCIIDPNIAYILSFSYGKYANINTGNTIRELEFIHLLENKYLSANSYIDLSPKLKRKYSHLKSLH